MIDAAKNVPTVEKFIYISTIAITRPWSFISLLLNIYIKDVMSWKLETENYLRSSGLNHVIIRPGGLLKEKDSKATAVTLAQGDKSGGLVERISLAKVILSVSEDLNFKPKVTFEVFSKKEQMTENFIWKTPNLVEDVGNKIIIPNKNFKARKIVVYGFWSIITLTMCFAFHDKITNMILKIIILKK